MRLIIDIPELAYNEIKEDKPHWLRYYNVLDEYILNAEHAVPAIPIDRIRQLMEEIVRDNMVKSWDEEMEHCLELISNMIKEYEDGE